MKGLKKKEHSLFDLYTILFQFDNKDFEGLLSMLLQNFEYIYQNTQCDCGSEGCFFDLLKSNQTHFFKGSYFLGNLGINFDKITDDFRALWSSFSKRQQVTLVYLFRKFENSTLLNLAFLKPDFDLYRYQILMCHPYQPDEPDDFIVRYISTLANYFLHGIVDSTEKSQH